MKSLNDSLREEFSEILYNQQNRDMISQKKIDVDLIHRAFDKLLDNKNGSDETALVEKGRAEFETYIINTLKTKERRSGRLQIQL